MSPLIRWQKLCIERSDGWHWGLYLRSTPEVENTGVSQVVNVFILLNRFKIVGLSAHRKKRGQNTIGYSEIVSHRTRDNICPYAIRYKFCLKSASQLPLEGKMHICICCTVYVSVASSILFIWLINSIGIWHQIIIKRESDQWAEPVF